LKGLLLLLDLKKANPTPEDADKLARLKAERDGLYQVVEKLITVREAIRNYLYRPFIPKKKKRSWRTSKRVSVA
jgi:hypothetical protein